MAICNSYESDHHKQHGCVSGMSDASREKLATVIVETLLPLCSHLSKQTICPVCAVQVITATALKLARDYGRLNSEEALRAVLGAFNSLYAQDGIQLTGAILEQEPRH